MTEELTRTRTIVLPSPRALVGGVYAVCVLGMIAVFAGQILFTDIDPNSVDGPVSSIESIGLVGTAALVIGVGVGLALIRTPEGARIGAILFGALSVITLVFFWSGAPGVLGACAAWQAGLTRGGRSLSGAARVAGVVGAFAALLNVVLTVGGMLFTAVTH
jgi:hypothetical protein